MFSNAKARYPKEGTYRGRVAQELTDVFAVHTPEAAYWSGWLSANTTIVRATLPNNRTKDFAIITTVETEREHLLECLRFLGTSDAISKPTERGTITHKSGVLSPILEKQGIVYGKTSANVPDWCTSSVDYWRGYVDANGDTGINKDGVLYLDVQCPELVKAWLFNFLQTYDAGSKDTERKHLYEQYNNGIVVYGNEAIEFFMHITQDGNELRTPKSISFNRSFNQDADAATMIEGTEQETPLSV